MYLLTKQIREAGTQIVLGKGADARVYHFKPRDPRRKEENHTCNVDDQRDLATLLAIPEGFCLDPNQEAPNPFISDPKPAARSAAAPPPPPRPAPATAPTTAAPAAGAQSQPPAPAGTDYTKLDRAELLKLASAKAGKDLHKTTSTKKLLEILGAE